MYANNRYSVLIVLQGMDTSGKDSLVKQVFKNFNARGVVVYSFKHTSAELEHDYLWRHYSIARRGSLRCLTVLITKMYWLAAYIPRFCLTKTCRE
jgi:polyphosphate kinase 2 (PPK2 family)